MVWRDEKEGQSKLKLVKNKILDRVKDKKLERRDRRLSVSSSVGSSVSQKRENPDNVSTDIPNQKIRLGVESRLPVKTLK